MRKFLSRPVLVDKYGASELLGSIYKVTPSSHPDLLRRHPMDHVTIAMEPPVDWCQQIRSTAKIALHEVKGTLKEIRHSHGAASKGPILLGYELDSSVLAEEIRTLGTQRTKPPHISIMQIKDPEISTYRTSPVDWLSWLIDEQCIPPSIAFSVGPVVEIPLTVQNQTTPNQPKHVPTTSRIGELFDFTQFRF